MDWRTGMMSFALDSVWSFFNHLDGERELSHTSVSVIHPTKKHELYMFVTNSS